jgi:hypothetical protein
MFFQANLRIFFYFGIPNKLGWSFVIRHDPRGKMIKYNVIEEEEDTEEVEEKLDDIDGEDEEGDDHVNDGEDEEGNDDDGYVQDHGVPKNGDLKNM